MKTLKIFSYFLLAISAMLLSSCEDWLTLYPENDLTEESFWEDANDLNGVRYSAYRTLASSDNVRKILTWGEMRSDNVVLTDYNSVGDYFKYRDMVVGRLDTLHNVFQWNSFYSCINMCNKVLEHGDDIVKSDPQFTQSQWTYIKAEMVALRSLCYFYLIRAFSDVPYVTTSIDRDDQVAYHRQVPQVEILDKLIADVSSITELAKPYAAGDCTSTKCLLTKPAIYALLADLYLWRAAKYEGAGDMANRDLCLDNVKKYCDLSLEADFAQIEKVENKEKEDPNLVGPYNLLQNYSSVATADQGPTMEGFTSLFHSNGSTESLFELAFLENGDKQSNGGPHGLFGEATASSPRLFFSNLRSLRKCAPLSAGDNDELKDLRLVYSAAYGNAKDFVTSDASSISFQENGLLMKYYKLSKFSRGGENSSSTSAIWQVSFEQNSYCNFIIYRRADVLLMKAEALAQKNEDMPEIRRIISELRRRSNGYQYDGYDEVNQDRYGLSAKVEAFADFDAALKAVLNERQLEFVGEGKRWFDIVRYAERKGIDCSSLDNQMQIMKTDIFGKETGIYKAEGRDNFKASLRSALRYRWSLYCPVFYNELKVSKFTLKQNPCWDNDSNTN